MATPVQVVLRAHYPTKRVLLASCRTAGGGLSLFVPTTSDVPAGTAVRLQVSFGDAKDQFELEGMVTWRRVQARGLGLEPGLGVEFAPPEKYRAAQMLAFCAGRPLAAGTATERRIPAKLPCWVRVGPHRIAGFIRDLSSTGAFVSSPGFARLSQGTELFIQLSTGWLGFGVRQLKARVVWSGQKNGRFGFGARFIEDSTRTKPVLRRYLATKPQR
ncbi:MAG: PilZ domain-containing protein [Deltaproteobacteria bacterium]|nr:PilZ domain-containing protein [Deltaproteobacteria bacterium]